MKICATCKAEKSEGEFGKKADAKDGLYPHCKECKRAIDAAYRVANAEKIRAHDRERGQQPNRKATQKARLAARYVAHKDEHLAAVRQYHAEHPELVREAKRAYKERNPSKVLAATRKRQAMKLNAMPAWANTFFIEEAYDLARRRTEATGFEWQVDHVIPLQHPLVCGLHVETNLQVIPAKTNQKKGNKFIPFVCDMTRIDSKGESMCSSSNFGLT